MSDEKPNTSRIEEEEEDEGVTRSTIHATPSVETITIVASVASDDRQVDAKVVDAAAVDSVEAAATAAVTASATVDVAAFISDTPRWVDSQGTDAWYTEEAVDAALTELLQYEGSLFRAGITWNQEGEHRKVGSCGVSLCGWRIEKVLDTKSTTWYVRIGNIAHSNHHETVPQSTNNNIDNIENVPTKRQEDEATVDDETSPLPPQISPASQSGEVVMTVAPPRRQVSQPGAYRVYSSHSLRTADFERVDFDEDLSLRRGTSSALATVQDTYLVEADLVEPESDRPLVEGKPVKRKMQFLVLLGVLLFGALAVGLPVGLISANRAAATATVPPTTSTTQGVPDSELIDDFRQQLPNATIAALNETSTPQYKAFQWLTSNEHPLLIQGDNPMASMIQRFALATLYYATDGGNWTSHLGWLDSSQNECTWPGCVCSTTTEGGGSSMILQSLSLKQNNLSGTLPRELSLLSPTLVELDLTNNTITGSIPSEFGDLVNLGSLLLGGNWLSGSIPTELGELLKLTDLDLNFNSFDEGSTIPTELGNLDNLQTLNLWMNSLVGTIPSELTKLSKLIDLNLGDNYLSGTIPTKLGRLVDLEVLWLGGDEYYGFLKCPFPSEFAKLSRLKKLHLAKLVLTGTIPTELGDMSSLEILRLDETQLMGPIPTELGRLSRLMELNIEKDQENKLNGTIPTELSGLVELSFLSLSRNDLSGSIPPAFGQLSALTTLHLAANQLNGTIPPEIGDLANLESFFLFENALTGSLPTALGTLSRLTDLSLFSNGLSGTIPTELRALSNLLYLFLWGNALTGSIPSQLGELSKLTELFLAMNQLSGTIPTELGLLSGLTQLILSDNSLTGTIPEQIAELTSLQRFKVWNTGLSGSVPKEICNLVDSKFVKVCTDVECDCGCITSDDEDECLYSEDF